MKKRAQSSKQENRPLLHQVQYLPAHPFQPVSIGRGQPAILGSLGKGIDNVEHGGSLLQEKCLFDDLGLLLGDLELPGESVDGAFRIIDMGFSRNAETIVSPLRLADDAPHDVRELVHGLARDVLVTGIHGGSAYQTVGTDQSVIECLDGQREEANLGIGDGNTGNNFVLLSQVKGFVVIRHFQDHHLLVQGELDFSCRVKSGFQDLGQHFHVVGGRVTLGKQCPEPVSVKSTKESLPLWRSCSIQ
jgi:hypothetical protein